MAIAKRGSVLIMWNDYGKKQHFTTKQALKSYEEEKAQHSNGIVTLDQLDCGHWTVRVYDSEVEKDAFLFSKLSEMMKKFWSPFTR